MVTVSSEGAPFVGLILHVEQLRPRAGGWKYRKCARCTRTPSELVVRFWTEADEGTPEAVFLCRGCLTDVEVQAWRAGTFYRVRPEVIDAAARAERALQQYVTGRRHKP